MRHLLAAGGLLGLLLSCSCGHVPSPPKPATARAAHEARREPVQYSRVLAAPRDASASLVESAADARRVLEQMTGARFESGVVPSGRGIILIRTRDAGVSAGDVRRLENAGPEAFVLRSEGAERFWVVANGDLGLVHGLYEYLRRLGCRWFMPGDDWTVVPHREDIAVEADDLVAPAFDSREFFGTGGFGHPTPADPHLAAKRAWDDWKRRNGFGGSFVVQGHTGEAFNAAHRRELEAHPEYMALVGGKRSPVTPGAKLCVSNPDAVKLYVEDRLTALRAAVQKDPPTFGISVEPGDGGGFCECDKCRALGSGSISDQVFYLANRVARAVAMELPGKKVTLYAYAQHAALPTLPLEPNVYVAAITEGFQRTGMAPDDLLRAWAKRTHPLGVYTYWGLPDGTHELPSFDWRSIPPDRARLWRALGVRSVNIETSSGIGAVGLGLYLAGRLFWNPSTDVERLEAEFFDVAFGRTAPPMRRMLERWAAGFLPTFHEIGLSYRDLVEARALAGTDVAVSQRVRRYEEYVQYIQLWLEYQSVPVGSPLRSERGRALLTWIYRIAPSGMVATHRIQELLVYRHGLDPAVRAEFDLANPSASGWRTIVPPLEGEMARLVEASRAAHPPYVFDARRYSSRLVPLSAASRPPPAAPAAMTFAGPTDFEFEVPKGRTSIEVEMAVTKGWWVAGDQVTLTDPGGQVVFSQAVPPDGRRRTLPLPTAHPGRYRLHVEDQKAMFFFRPPVGIPMAVLGFLSPAPSPAMYFFVPKGLRRLAIYAASATPIQLNDPDGRVVPCPAENLVVVDVPAGEDGRVWSVRNFKGWEALRLLNAPQSFAFSPDTVLVPAELQ